MVASALTSTASFAARAHAAPVPPSTGRRSVAPVRSRPGPSPCSTTDGVALPRAPEPRRRDVAAHANGSEGDVITTIGQYAGAAVGVVALAYAAGAQSSGGDPSDDSGSSGAPSSASAVTPKPSSGKQTIAGSVAGANNANKRNKPIPGMPKRPDAASQDSQTSGKNSGAQQQQAGGIADMMSGAMKAMGGAGPQLATRKAAYKWGAADATGPREYMEDAWAVRESGFAGGYLFAAVMDGHGGEASSAYLRENLFDALDGGVRRGVGANAAGGSAPGSAPDGTPDGGYLAPSLSRAYEAADETLIDHIARLGEPECWSGSTCTSVLVRHDRVVAANVGDSRAILVRDNKAIELTSDHRPVGSCKTGRQEMDRVVRAGGWSVGGRVCGILAVSRAFGDYEFKGGRFDLLEDLSEEPLAKKATLAEPPVVPTPAVFECAREPERDQWLVVASDGLWDTVNSTQCATFIKQETKKNPDVSADQLADALVKRAIRFRTQDNVAVVVVDLREETAA